MGESRVVRRAKLSALRHGNEDVVLLTWYLDDEWRCQFSMFVRLGELEDAVSAAREALGD